MDSWCAISGWWVEESEDVDADAKERVGEGLRLGEEEREFGFVPKSLPERTRCSMSASIVFSKITCAVITMECFDKCSEVWSDPWILDLGDLI